MWHFCFVFVFFVLFYICWVMYLLTIIPNVSNGVQTRGIRKFTQGGGAFDLVAYSYNFQDRIGGEEMRLNVTCLKLWDITPSVIENTVGFTAGDCGIICLLALLVEVFITYC